MTKLDVANKELVRNYFSSLINSFFKILPMKESGEASLPVYIESLQVELAGCEGVLAETDNDPSILSLISILQYFIDNPDCSVGVIRREVFKAISICNKIATYYDRKAVL